ncbi:MAG: NUDIX domain-containing protein [Dermatophilaceae bacterium]
MPIPDFVVRLREKVGHDLIPMTGATGVVRDATGRILLGLRADTREWALPSGIIEPFEEPAVALAREIEEEAGIHARVDALVAVSATGEVRYPNGDVATYLDFTFLCTHLSGDPHPADGENVEIGWFALDALPPLRASSTFRLGKALAYDGTTWFAR